MPRTPKQVKWSTVKTPTRRHRITSKRDVKTFDIFVDPEFRTPPAMFKKIQKMEPKVSIYRYYDTARDEWMIPYMQADYASLLFKQIRVLDPKARKAMYFDAEEVQWDIIALEDDLKEFTKRKKTRSPKRSR